MSKKRFDTVEGKPKEVTPMMEALQKEAEKKQKVFGFNPEEIKSRDTYEGQEKFYKELPLDYFDPYENYIDKTILKSGEYTLEELGKMRADYQSNLQQTANAIGQFAVNVVPQIIGGFASMIDIEGYFDAEAAANNGIVNWAKDVEEWSKEAMPIYEEAPGESMQLGDWAWWMSRGSGLATSVASFIAQGAGAGKIAQIGLKGLSKAGTKQLATKLTNAEISKRLYGATSALTTATMLNQSEAVIEATQVYQDIYDQSILNGLTEEDARKKASTAAATTINLNRINILLNLSSAAAFLKPQSYTRQLLEAPSFKKNLLGLGLEGSQEAAEELINLAASKAGMAVGEGKKYTLQNALEDMATMEGLESAFLGALGGIAQTGGTNLLNRTTFAPSAVLDPETGQKISKFDYQKKQYEKQQKIISELKEKGVNVTDTMKNINDQLIFIEKLKNASTEEERESLREQLFEQQALKAFQSGTTEILEGLYKAEAEKSVEEVGEEHIKKAQQAIENLKELERIYNNHEEYSDVGDIFYNRASKIRIQNAINETESQYNIVHNEFSKLVQNIAKKYQKEESKEVIIKKEGKEEERYVRKNKIPLTYNLENLENNPEEDSTNKKVYDEFLKEVKSLPQFDQFTSLAERKEALEDSLLGLEKSYKILTSKEHQQKAKKREERRRLVQEGEKILDKSSSISEIEKLKEEINDEDFSKKADKKIQEIKENLEKKKSNKKQKAKADFLSEKIEKASKEELENIRKEVETAELSDPLKNSLLDKINNKEELIESGAPITMEEMGFESVDPTEKVNIEDEKSTVKVPKDLPNINTEEATVEEKISQAVEKISQEKSSIIGTDEKNNLVYDYARVSTGSNRLAYLSRNFIQTEEGGIVSREDADDEILNKQVLDQEEFSEGSSITLEIDLDYQGPKYDPSSTTKETILWAERERQLQVKYGEDYKKSDEYINEVPIKVTSKKGTVVYLHDVSWINPENVLASEQEMLVDQTILREIRKQVISKGKVNTKITYKGNGRLILSKDKKGVIASEALPDNNIIIAVAKDSGQGSELKYNTSKKVEGKLNIPFELNEGAAYALVPLANGTTIPVPLKRNVLSKEVVDSIMTVLEIYFSEDTSNPLVAEIANSSLGADITTLRGVEKYLKQFIYLYPTDKVVGLEQLLSSTLSEDFNSAINILSVTGNSIDLGRPKVNMGGNKKVLSLSKNLNKQDNLKKLQGPVRKHLEGMLSNVNLDMIQSSLSEAILVEEGKVRSIPYYEYVKSSHNSRVLGVNIGTEENPKYAYTIQPAIIFDSSFINQEEIRKQSEKTISPSSNDVGNKKADIEKRKAQATIESTDKIIWAHPGLGKTTFRNANPENVLDFDTDFKPEIAKQLGLPEGQRDSVSLNAWRKKSKANEQKFEAVMKKVWQEAIQQARETGKMLLVSDMMFLRENANDFDKIITTDRETFNKRASERGDDVSELESWKSNIDKTIAGIDQSKVVSTNKYFAELVALEKEEPLSQQINKVSEEASFEEQVEIALKQVIENQISNEALLGLIENLEAGAVEGGSIEDIKILKEVINRRAKKSSFKGNLFQVDIDENTVDDEDPDDMIPILSDEEKEEMDSTADQFIIRGIDGKTQDVIIKNIGAQIIAKSISKKESSGDGKVSTKDIFDSALEDFKALQKFYIDSGFPNKARKVERVVEQFDKVIILTNQYLNLLNTGSAELIDLTDSEAEGGLTKTVYTDDWAFTVNSKTTASADLRKFFSSIRDKGADQRYKKSSIGLPEILDMDVVYNTLHEKLAGKPADFDTLISILEINSKQFPWFVEVIEKLEDASDKIKNEFVSDMTKHHMSMDFVMWSKDANGNYSLKVWNSNSSAIQHRLRQIWNSNLKGRALQASIITVNDSGDYIFDKAEMQRVINQLKTFKEDIDSITVKDLQNWFNNFGITLSDKTIEDIKNGKYKNGGKINWKSFFVSKNSPAVILTNQLQKYINSGEDVLLENIELFTDTSIKKLAELEAHNIENVFSNSYNAGGKTVYSYTNNNYLADRIRELTSEDGTLLKGLKEISFTSDSLWLSDLTSDDTETRELAIENLGFSYLSLEALKKLFTPSKDNRKLNNLSPQEHEVAKINFFLNNSKVKINGQNRRKVKFFYPTMSDKTTMVLINSLAYELDLASGILSDNNVDLLFKAAVLPEINRIMSEVKSDSVNGYTPNYFYYMPTLNDLEITFEDGTTQTVLEAVIDKKGYTKEVQDHIKNHLKEVFNSLVEEKLEDWKDLGIGIYNEEENIRYSFLDKEYMSNVAKGLKGEGKVKYAAADFVFNSLIANAEIHTLFVGDPALYFKKSKIEGATIMDHIEETSINIGKRLAGDIAPGMALADSENNQYRQVFFKDTEVQSNNLKSSIQKEYLSKILPSYSKDYGKIEGSDAQEYTTWKEHIYVLNKLGRLTNKQLETLTKKLESQSTNGVNRTNKLSYDELGLVLQPIKPVYVGNILSIKENLDRRVYIKSSSFPLIPELTSGLEIDKIRTALENYEKESGTTVRASFDTANKVGAIKNSIKVFDENSRVSDNLKITDDNTLLLSRKNFRIQQDVPYKREKEAINIGTQERKLLFVNILKSLVKDNVTGEMLLDEYNIAYKNLFENAYEELQQKLGIGQTEEVIETYEASEEITDSLKAAILQEVEDNPKLLEKLVVSLDDINQKSFEQLGELVKLICS